MDTDMPSQKQIKQLRITYGLKRLKYVMRKSVFREDQCQTKYDQLLSIAVRYNKKIK